MSAKTLVFARLHQHPQVANTCNLWYGSKMERDGDISVIEVEEFIFNGRVFRNSHFFKPHQFRLQGAQA